MSPETYKTTIWQNNMVVSTENSNNLMDVILRCGDMLHSMGILHCLSEGTLVRSYFHQQSFDKKYVIYNKIPNCKIEIKKTSSGNIDCATLKRYIKLVKELYERNIN